MTLERWVILAALFAARTAMAFQFQTIGSVGPILVNQLAIDYSQVGTLMGLYLLPGLALALPGGLLGQRFGAKTVFVLGLMLMTGGGLEMGFSSSFTEMAIGRFISGAGAVLMNVMATKMVADWFIDRKLPTAMAILVASWPFGIGLGLVVDHGVVAESGLATLMYLAASMTLTCIALTIVVYRAPPKQLAPVRANLKSDLTSYEVRLVLVGGAIWATYNVGYIVLMSFAPEFFTIRGYSLAQSSWIVSLIGWLLIPMIAIGGILADKLGRPTLIMISGLVVTSLAAVALPFVSAPAALFLLIALAAGLPAGPIMALPATVLQPQNRAVGMGVFFTCYYAGMAALPVVAGVVRDLTQSPSAPILFSAAMIVCSLILLVVFRALERPKRAPARKHFA